MSRYAPYRDLVVTLAAPQDVSIEGADQITRDDAVVTLRFRPDLVTAPAVIAAVTAQHEVVDLAVVEPRLETVLSGIYTRRGVPTERT